MFHAKLKDMRTSGKFSGVDFSLSCRSIFRVVDTVLHLLKSDQNINPVVVTAWSLLRFYASSFSSSEHRTAVVSVLIDLLALPQFNIRKAAETPYFEILPLIDPFSMPIEIDFQTILRPLVLRFEELFISVLAESLHSGSKDLVKVDDAVVDVYSKGLTHFLSKFTPAASAEQLKLFSDKLNDFSVRPSIVLADFKVLIAANLSFLQQFVTLNASSVTLNQENAKLLEIQLRLFASKASLFDFHKRFLVLEQIFNVFESFSSFFNNTFFSSHCRVKEVLSYIDVVLRNRILLNWFGHLQSPVLSRMLKDFRDAANKSQSRAVAWLFDQVMYKQIYY